MRRSTATRYRPFFYDSYAAVLMAALSIIIMLMALSGCVLRSVAGPEDFAKEDMRLTEQIKALNEPAFLSDLYLERARLRLRADNPHHDYNSALEDLKHAVELNPRLQHVEDLKDWIAALNRLAYAEREADKLRSKNIQAERQIRTLQKMIEELQSLEFQMERQRQFQR